MAYRRGHEFRYQEMAAVRAAIKLKATYKIRMRQPAHIGDLRIALRGGKGPDHRLPISRLRFYDSKRAPVFDCVFLLIVPPR